MIYSYTHNKQQQALLVHRPRFATLRSRTRMDRYRTSASDLAAKEHDEALINEKFRSRSRKPASGVIPRDTNRPFFSLTQTCRLLRHEYRPIYMLKQEVGVDLTSVVTYLQTFYSEAPALMSELHPEGGRKIDLPFTGNITIAVGDKANDTERRSDGVDVLPLLDIWANSYRIEAGFGRYVKEIYVPTLDGEAKDL
jgi:hypothetical protein